MTTFADQQQEATALLAKFDAFYSYCEVGLARTEFIADYFAHISSVMRGSASQISLITDVDLKKPGLRYGRVEHNSLFIHAYQLGTIENMFVEEFELTSKFIDDTAHAMLRGLIEKTERGIDDVKKEVSRARKARTELSDAFAKDQRAAEHCCAEVTKAHARLCEVRTQSVKAKMEQRAAEQLSSCIEAYHKSLSALSASTALLNASHEAFVETVAHAIASYREIETARIEQIHTIFSICVQQMETIAGSIKSKSNCWNDLVSDWRRLFSAACIEDGISRGALEPLQFEEYKFSFSDSDLRVEVPEFPAVDLDAPAFVCTVLADFQGAGEREMSVSKGEEVFAFELATHEWIYVNSLDRSRRGYVPSKALRINEEIDLGFVIETFISSDENNLSVGAGEVVIIEGKHNSGYICRRGRDNEYGFIPANVLILRSSIKSLI